MTLTPQQMDLLRSWAAQGIDLNGIQKKLAQEAGLHMTYMELRFLLLDNGIEIASVPEPAPKVPEAASPQTEEAVPVEEEAAGPMAGKPKLTLDDIQIPGALLSGKVLFPSGIKGAWQIDQAGRFDWTDLSGEPSPEEMKGFQFELMQMLRQG